MSRIEGDEIVTVGTPFRKIAAVGALEPHRVAVTWKDEHEKTIVDLAPTIFTFKIYAPLRNDQALFDTVHLVDDLVIAWGEDDAIDMHAVELERLADEMMATDDFRAFLDDMLWTRDTAAAQLGMSRRTIGYYATGTPIPRYVALACAQLRSSQSGVKRDVSDRRSVPGAESLVTPRTTLSSKGGLGAPRNAGAKRKGP